MTDKRTQRYVAHTMSVAKVIEISSTSSSSFDDAETQGVAKASATVKNIKGAWVKDMRVSVDNNAITNYQVNLQITFVLD